MLILSRAWLALMPGLAGAASLSQARLRGAAGHQEIVSVALHEGAQGLNFDLFHPQLPQITAKEETSTSVPVIHLPADREDDEKVAADAILEMFPQDLLENNKRVRPVDVKIIEHDGYIDYEIEFVELPDYYDYYDEDYNFGEKIEEQTTTTTESSTSPNSNTPEITFVNLLKKARNKHRQRQRAIEKQVMDVGSSDLRSDNAKLTETDQENFISHINRLDKTSPPSKLVSSTPVPRQVVQNSGRTGRSTTTAKPEPSEVTDPYGQHETSFYETTTATELATTFEILSASPEYSEIPRSSFSQLDKIDEEGVPTTSTNPQSDYFEYSDDFLGSDSQPHLSVYSSQDAARSEAVTEAADLPETESHTMGSYSERIPKKIDSKGGSAQLISKTKDKDLDTGGQYTEVNPGQYHETNPGQYHEVNPGQDYEVNPGQYHETNPGQYHEVNPGQDYEVNPGQYHEVNPGQYRLEDKDIQVSVDDNREDDSRTYDVRANAGDFIIGEVGRIDISSGQTLEGVRYTALESEVDYEKIKEILEMYFGARTTSQKK